MAGRDDGKAGAGGAWSRPAEDHRTDFERPEKPLGRRLAAAALWAAGFAAMLLSIMTATGALEVPVLGGLPVLAVALGLVVDAAAVVAGQRMWRAAGRLPGARQGPLTGAAASCFAFPPTALYFLSARNAGAKLKGAAVASALAGAAAMAACAVALS